MWEDDSRQDEEGKVGGGGNGVAGKDWQFLCWDILTKQQDCSEQVTSFRLSHFLSCF